MFWYFLALFLSGFCSSPCSSQRLCETCPLPCGDTDLVVSVNSTSLICGPCPSDTPFSLLFGTSCLSCPPAHFWSGPDLRQCFPCPFDTQFASGLTRNCSQCPPERPFAPQNASSSSDCISCNPGFAWDPSNRFCVPCGPGQISQQNSRVPCSFCPSNRPFAVRHQCVTCPIGTRFVRSSCEPCPEGQFAPQNSKICFSCPPERPFPSLNAFSFDDCISCPPGTFYNQVQRQCQPCDRGSYSASTNAFNCSSCPSSTPFTAHVGASSSSQCFACDPGHFWSNRLRNCSSCDAFSFSSGLASQCTPCPETRPFAPFQADNLLSCKVCSRGFAWDASSRTCKTCPGGALFASGMTSFCSTCSEGSSLRGQRTTLEAGSIEPFPLESMQSTKITFVMLARMQLFLENFTMNSFVSLMEHRGEERIRRVSIPVTNWDFQIRFDQISIRFPEIAFYPSNSDFSLEWHIQPSCEGFQIWFPKLDLRTAAAPPLHDVSPYVAVDITLRLRDDDISVQNARESFAFLHDFDLSEHDRNDVSPEQISAAHEHLLAALGLHNPETIEKISFRSDLSSSSPWIWFSFRVLRTNQTDPVQTSELIASLLQEPLSLLFDPELAGWSRAPLLDTNFYSRNLIRHEDSDASSSSSPDDAFLRFVWYIAGFIVVLGLAYIVVLFLKKNALKDPSSTFAQSAHSTQNLSSDTIDPGLSSHQKMMLLLTMILHVSDYISDVVVALTVLRGETRLVHLLIISSLTLFIVGLSNVTMFWWLLWSQFNRFPARRQALSSWMDQHLRGLAMVALLVLTNLECGAVIAAWLPRFTLTQIPLAPHRFVALRQTLQRRGAIISLLEDIIQLAVQMWLLFKYESSWNIITTLSLWISVISVMLLLIRVFTGCVVRSLSHELKELSLRKPSLSEQPAALSCQTCQTTSPVQGPKPGPDVVVAQPSSMTLD